MEWLDLWYLWPDGYMVSMEERNEFEEALIWKSDDYQVVVVTAYDETYSPCEWVEYKR